MHKKIIIGRRKADRSHSNSSSAEPPFKKPMVVVSHSLNSSRSQELPSAINVDHLIKSSKLKQKFSDLLQDATIVDDDVNVLHKKLRNMSPRMYKQMFDDSMNQTSSSFRTMSPSNRHLESTAIGSPLPGRGRGGGKENMPRQGLADCREELEVTPIQHRSPSPFRRKASKKDKPPPLALPALRQVMSSESDNTPTFQPTPAVLKKNINARAENGLDTESEEEEDMIVLENDYVLEPDPEDVLEAEKDMDEPEERSPVHDEFHISDDDDIHARAYRLSDLDLGFGPPKPKTGGATTISKSPVAEPPVKKIPPQRKSRSPLKKAKSPVRTSLSPVKKGKYPGRPKSQLIKEKSLVKKAKEQVLQKPKPKSPVRPLSPPITAARPLSPPAPAARKQKVAAKTSESEHNVSSRSKSSRNRDKTLTEKQNPSRDQTAAAVGPSSIDVEPDPLAFKVPALPAKGMKPASRPNSKPRINNAATTAAIATTEPSDIPAMRPDKTRYLVNWVPRLRFNKLIVEGDIIDFNKPVPEKYEERWITSKIVNVISPQVVCTKSTDYVLEGTMLPSAVSQNIDTPTPMFIMHKFKMGFPSDWMQLVDHWRRFEVERRENEKNSTVFWNSTINSALGVGQGNFGNLSSISGMSCTSNMSHFIPSNFRPVGHSSVLPTLIESPLGSGGSFNRSQEAPARKTLKKPMAPPASRLVENEVISRMEATVASRLEVEEEALGTSIISKGDVESRGKQRRARSRGVRANKNSSRLDAASDKPDIPDQTCALERTMSIQDYSTLRAKSYANVTLVNKKKNYNCDFCDFVTNLFGNLKIHVRSNHLEPERPVAAAPVLHVSFSNPRARSDESILNSSALETSPLPQQHRRKSLETPQAKKRPGRPTAKKLNSSTSQEKNTPKTAESKIKDRNTSKSKEKNISKSKERNTLKSSKERNTSKSKEKYISKSKERNTSKSKERNTSKSKDRNTSKSKERNTSKSKDRNTSKSKERNTSKSKDRNTSKSKEKKTSKSNDRNTSKSKERKTSKSKERKTSKSKDRNTSKSKRINTSKSKERNSSISQERNKSFTKNVDVSKNTEKSTPKKTAKSKTVKSVDKKSTKSKRGNTSQAKVEGFSRKPFKRKSLDMSAVVDEDMEVLPPLSKKGKLLDNPSKAQETLPGGDLAIENMPEGIGQNRVSLRKIEFFCAICPGNNHGYNKSKALNHAKTRKHKDSLLARHNPGTTDNVQTIEANVRKKSNAPKSKLLNTPKMKDDDTSSDNVKTTTKSVEKPKKRRADPGVSRFGRARKNNSLLNSESWADMTTTPPVTPVVQTKKNKATKKKLGKSAKSPVVNKSIRQPAKPSRLMVKNPLKHKPLRPVEDKKKTTSIDELVINPKTVKDRVKNAEIFEELNRGHEDDIFKQRGAKDGQAAAMFDLLANQDDSDGSEISVYSARTPVEKYKRVATMKGDVEKTPNSENNSPVSPVKNNFHSYAHIHKKIAEHKAMERQLKRKKLTSALQPNIISKNSKQQKIDASCRIFETFRPQDQDDEDESETEDWFPEDDEANCGISKLSAQGSLLHSLRELNYL